MKGVLSFHHNWLQKMFDTSSIICSKCGLETRIVNLGSVDACQVGTRESSSSEWSNVEFLCYWGA